MVMEVDDKSLARCRVLYIGSAVPLEASQGMDAIQQPLSERFSVKNDRCVSGVDSLVTITLSGISLRYVRGSNTEFEFPIDTLTFCAAVRSIQTISEATGHRVSRFVSLFSPAASGINKDKPAIFTAITRRRIGRKVLECHGFICGSDKDAVSLVQAAKVAYRHHGQQSRLQSVSDITHSRSVVHPDLHLIPADDHPKKENVSSEFYEAPPMHGYFYSNKDPKLVKNYTIARAAPGPRPVTLERHPQPVPFFKKSVPAYPHLRYFSPPPVPTQQPLYAAREAPIYTRPIPRGFRNHSPSDESRSHASSVSDHTFRENGASPLSLLRQDDRTFRKPTSNGQQAGETSSENSLSRPRTPTADYERAEVRPKPDRLSRKDQYNLYQKQPPYLSPQDYMMMGYPYSPYVFQPYFYPTRPRSLPPESRRSSQKEHGKNKKEKKKTKKKTKKSKTFREDTTGDNHGGYHSEIVSGRSAEVQRRHHWTGQREFQNERAFAKSIREEMKQGNGSNYPNFHNAYDSIGNNPDYFY